MQKQEAQLYKVLEQDFIVIHSFSFSLTKPRISLTEALLQQRLMAEIREICKVKYSNAALEDGLQFLSTQSSTIRMKGRLGQPLWLRAGAIQHSVLLRQGADLRVSLRLLRMCMCISLNYHTEK